MATRTSVAQRATVWGPVVWSFVLACALLGPALAPGFVLTYDMVWAPDLALRADTLGLGSGLPRAVPSDAIVAVVDEVVPGMVLQKVVLLAALAGGGVGVVALLDDAPLAARLAAVTAYQWNPYVVERLLIGHWPMLVAYAVLPWIVRAMRSARRTRAVPAYLWALLALGSLSASAGLVTAVTVLATSARGLHRRVLLGLAAVNAPWVAAGMMHAAEARTDAAGARLFALNGVDLLPAPLAAIGLGGIWNGEVMLPSRDTWTAPAALVLLLVLTTLGWAAFRRRHAGGEARALGVMWVVGWSLAVTTWAAPGLVAWLAAEVPGGGLLRDGSRALALCALPVALVVAAGTEVVVARCRRAGAVPSAVAAFVLVLWPVTLLPDASWGLSGRLDAVDYPAEVAQMAEAVPHDVGDVVVLPFASYRAPDWNGERKVLDPVPRLLPHDVVADDRLRVSGRTVAGEDPRAARAAAALRLQTPDARTAALLDLGVGVAVLDVEQASVAPATSAPELNGTMTDLGLYRVIELEGQARPRTGPEPGWVVAMGLAWAVYAGTLVLTLASAVRRGAEHEREPRSCC